MAGFLYNGCGVADSYYKLKSLEQSFCPRCKKERLWELAMLKMKIRVVFIPTVSINTKYAVMCSKCRQGYYVTDAQKDFILSNPSSCVEVLADGVVIHGMEQETGGAPILQSTAQPAEQPISQSTAQPAEPPMIQSPVQPAQQQAMQSMPQQVMQPISRSTMQPVPQSPVQPISRPTMQPVPQSPVQPASQAAVQPLSQPASSGQAGGASVCKKCGSPTGPGWQFCRKCGASLEAVRSWQSPRTEEKPSDNSSQLISRLGQRKICPKCQLFFPAGKEVCNICGSRLEDKH